MRKKDIRGGRKIRLVDYAGRHLPGRRSHDVVGAVDLRAFGTRGRQVAIVGRASLGRARSFASFVTFVRGWSRHEGGERVREQWRAERAGRQAGWQRTRMILWSCNSGQGC